MSQEEGPELANALQSLDLIWLTGSLHGRQGPSSNIRYVKIAELSGGKISLGISERGEWVRIGSDSIAVLSEAGPFFLPVLEGDKSSVREEISRGIGKIGAPADIATFPFLDVVLVGLRSRSEHWVTHALKWASDLPQEPRLLAALKEASSTAPTQRQRHSAKKLASRRSRALAGETDPM